MLIRGETVLLIESMKNNVEMELKFYQIVSDKCLFFFLIHDFERSIKDN